jgi:NitT/TauT family transport system substrate-binding protein
METKCYTLSRREFLKKTATGAAAIGFSGMAFPGIVFSKTTLRTGYLPILDHLTLMVSHARDNDSFKHIRIEPRMFKRWSAVSGALKAGVIDAAFLLSPLGMDMFAQGADIRSILVGHRNGSGITVKKDSEINAPADLKGKKIGIPSKISTHVAILDRWLRTGGISVKDVITRSIAPPNMIYALEQGRIDAFVVAEPFCAKAETEGKGRTLSLSKDIIPGHICCTVVVRNEILKSNPEGIREWVASLNRSGMFIDQDKAAAAKEVARIATKYMKFDEQTIIAGMMNPNDRITYSDLNPRIGDYQTILNISSMAGIIGNINLNDFIDDRFYRAIV